MISKVLRYCTRLFCRWHCVGVMEVISGPHDTYRKSQFFYYFMENRFGERKVRIAGRGNAFNISDGRLPISDWNGKRGISQAKETHTYMGRVEPWLLGRRDRDIPTFRDANTSKQEFLDALKDKPQNIKLEEK